MQAEPSPGAAPPGRWRSSSGCWPRRTAGLHPVQPGAGDDLGAGQGGAGPPRRLSPRRATIRRWSGGCSRSCGRCSARRPPTRCCSSPAPGTAAMEMAISSVGAAREKDARDRQRRLRRSAGRDRGAARDPARRAALAVGRRCRSRATWRGRWRPNPTSPASAMIQHETSVGLMNPVGEVGRLCRARGVTSIVDAVSALGVEDVDVVRDGVDICYSSANKCLHSVSGVSFLCVAPEVWPRIAASPPRVYYLDLVPPPPLSRRAPADAVHARGVVVLRARDGARRARRAGRASPRAARSTQAQPAHPAGVRRSGVRVVHQHGPRVAHHSTCACPTAFRRDLYERMKARGFIIYRAKGDRPNATSRSRTWASSPTGQSTPFWRRSPTSCGRPAAPMRPRRASRSSRSSDARRAVSPARRPRGDGDGGRARPHARPAARCRCASPPPR